MRLQDFVSFAEDEQLRYLCYNGVCVADREVDETLILLYQIDDFYVEVHHHLQNCQVIKLVSFDEGAALDAYLDKINVSEVLDAALH